MKEGEISCSMVGFSGSVLDPLIAHADQLTRVFNTVAVGSKLDEV